MPIQSGFHGLKACRVWKLLHDNLEIGVMRAQELGAPVLTIPEAVAAGSFYPAPGEPSFVAGTHPGRVQVGNPDARMAAAPNRITGARSVN